MTCGILCVMRKEGRDVLHLYKYSPPKANWFGRGGGGGGGGGVVIGEEKRKRKRKERRKTTERKENQQFSD